MVAGEEEEHPEVVEEVGVVFFQNRCLPLTTTSLPCQEALEAEEHQEEVVEEVLVQNLDLRSLLNHIVTLVCILLEEKKICSVPRTWSLVKVFMEKKESVLM